MQMYRRGKKEKKAFVPLWNLLNQLIKLSNSRHKIYEFVKTTIMFVSALPWTFMVSKSKLKNIWGSIKKWTSNYYILKWRHIAYIWRVSNCLQPHCLLGGIMALGDMTWDRLCILTNYGKITFGIELLLLMVSPIYFTR